MSTVLFVEDDKQQAAYFIKELRPIENGFQIIHAVNAVQAIDYAKKYEIDLFILDIELPDNSGLSMAEEIRKLPKYQFTWILFITGHKRFMTDAYKNIHCYDFITKPFEIDKVRSHVENLLNNRIVRQDIQEFQFLTIICRDIFYKLKTEDILFIEVNQRECKIHTYALMDTIKRLTLKNIASQLPSTNFVQCHKSFIVNIDYIKTIEIIDKTWTISFKNYDMQVVVGNSFKKNFFKVLSRKSHIKVME
jgi:DNA-binding LytR/AlgR family response regulator